MNERITNKEIYTFMADSQTDRALMHQKLDSICEIQTQMLVEVKKTNGRVSVLEQNAVATPDKMWVVKAIATGMLLTSWIWIKESRDFVLQFLGFI